MCHIKVQFRDFTESTLKTGKVFCKKKIHLSKPNAGLNADYWKSSAFLLPLISVDRHIFSIPIAM